MQSYPWLYKDVFEKVLFTEFDDTQSSVVVDVLHVGILHIH